MSSLGRAAATVAAMILVLTIWAASASASADGGDASVPEAAIPDQTAAADEPADEVTDPVAEDDGGDAGEPAPEAKKPRKSELNVRLKGLSGGKLKVGKRIKVAGTLRPFAKGERVKLLLRRGNKVVKKRTQVVKLKKKGSKLGQFGFSKKLVRNGRYSVQAIHPRSAKLSGSKDRSRNFKITYPSLNLGAHSDTVKLFNKLLAKLGYVNDEGKAYDAATGRAVLAYRKVNRMARIQSATSKIFERLAKGKGGYKLKYPNSGKHVEVDISRQVMVLAKGDKVDEIYHVSTGAAATPTLAGTWRFYRKEPGLNNKEMYYSVYYDRGYATHGYKSVPTHPASHGCTRNPPANSVHIYNWIDIGDLIHVYH